LILWTQLWLRRSLWQRIIVCFLLCFATAVYEAPPSLSFSQWYWIMERGDVGDDVAELQSRLRYVGYYSGTIDGSFGSATQRAVIRFQNAFGLRPDGRVGPRTKLKLAKATPGWSQSSTFKKASSYSKTEMKLMARTVYGEARGESYIGQVAVASVVLNRIRNPAFPKTISGVIFQPGAFTAVDDGQIWLEPNAQAYKAVRDALNGWDPSGGAIYYFNPVTATSRWIWSRPQIKKIGKHIFCL
jgi:N-acetylmuramoyl-L-alanine amidase